MKYVSAPQYLKQHNVAVERPLSYGTIENIIAIALMSPHMKISYCYYSNSVRQCVNKCATQVIKSRTNNNK